MHISWLGVLAFFMSVLLWFLQFPPTEKHHDSSQVHLLSSSQWWIPLGTPVRERRYPSLQRYKDLMLTASISVFCSFWSATQPWPLSFFFPSKVSAFLVSACHPRMTHSLAWVPSCSFRILSNACQLVPTQCLAVDAFRDSRSPAQHWRLTSEAFC